MSKNRKIVVIADDFTGAAEIGGIGLRHGLKVAIETEPIDKNGVDLLVIATDTRSMNNTDAANHISEITRKVLKLNPLLVYKKIDSVLRGNIAIEINAQLKAMNKKRAVIIAANPVFNRIIKNGQYFIDDIPLDKTCFAIDFQFPIQSNNVCDVLSAENDFTIHSMKPGDTLPEEGLIMGDVENLENLRQWTGYMDDNTLMAGASGFFNAILTSMNLFKQNNAAALKPFGKKVLFVLGSAYPKDTTLIENMEANGHFHSNMPLDIYLDADYPLEIFEAWYREVLNALHTHNKVIISSIHENSGKKGISKRIKKVVAELVEKISQEITLDEILIEGGSTTSEILRKLDIKRLLPLQELDTGVIRMQIDTMPNTCLTTKPGSYNWPENVWLQQEIKRYYKEHKTKINAQPNG